MPETSPEFPRKIVLSRRRLAGVSVLLAIPLLALSGVLGDSRRIETRREGPVVLEVESPRCARYGNPVWLTVRVTRDAGGAGSHSVEMGVSASYLARFSDIKSRPEASGHTADNMLYRQEIPAAGGVAPLRIELMPERYGWARGRVRAALSSGEVVELPLKTFVFP